MNDRLIFSEYPELTDPYIIVGLKGWLNAGEVAMGGIDYLRRKFGARKLGRIDSQGFYIYQVASTNPELTMRPHAQIIEGVVRVLDSPENDLYYWKSGTDRDLILLSGAEPNLNWPEYSRAIFDLAREFRVRRIYCLGGYFDQVPHTRETRINTVVSHEEMKRELAPIVNFTDYTGPCSFITMLAFQGNEQNIEVVATSARLPIYINDLNHTGCYHLLKKVLKMTGYQIDLSDLKHAGERQMEMVDQAFSKNPTALEQLKKMEELHDGAFGKEALRGTGDDYDKLLDEMRTLKREGRKPH
jgi:proteasome assembly chaperone (PAC2) family protein